MWSDPNPYDQGWMKIRSVFVILKGSEMDPQFSKWSDSYQRFKVWTGNISLDIYSMTVNLVLTQILYTKVYEGSLTLGEISYSYTFIVYIITFHYMKTYFRRTFLSIIADK